MTLSTGFNFPPLGPTGEGEIGEARTGTVYWQPEDYVGYYVTHQQDRPAVAYRCHYPGGSAPCDRETADRWVRWVEENVL